MAKKAAKAKTSGCDRIPGPEEGLNAAQLAFVELYCITLNASEAFRRLKLSHDVSRQSASQMRRNPKVDDEISRRLRQRGEYNDQLRREVLETQASIMRAQIGDVIDLSTLEIRRRIPARARVALSEINIKEHEGGRSMRVKLADKGVAAERLAKLLGMFEQVDPMEQKREQVGEAKVVVKERLAGLKTRLVPKYAGQELSLAEMAALEDVEVVD